MARNLALWSMTLLPGDKYPLYIRNDFVVTNAALGDELADENGRSVVKVTYHPINPALLGDDSDSEVDSEDFDDEDLEGLEDEFELDEDEGFKEVAKKAKANGNGAGPNDVEESEEDEEEEEDEEDDEDDDDFSDVEPEVTNVICSLTAGKTEQAQVNLTFVEGDAVMFEVTGKNAVHLMGNYIRQQEDYSSDEDSEFDSDEDDYDGLYDDEDDEEEAPVGKITEIPEKPTKKAVAAPVAAPVADKKRKADAVESPAGKTAAAAPTEQLSKKQKKLAAAAEANDAAKAAAKKEKEPKKEQASKKVRKSM